MSPPFSSLNLILIGPPGSGKGTQAALLCERFQVPHISTGDMLRDEIERGTTAGLEAEGKFSRGEPVNDQLVASRVLQRLDADDCARGFVLDGFPLNLEQAGLLDGVLAELGRGIERVVLIEVRDEVVAQRVAGRENDGEETIRQRLATYRSESQPLVDAYRDRQQLVTVDGDRAVSDVNNAILEAIETPVIA